MMENKEIEGVIIGVWRNSWTKPEPMMQRARQWQMWDLKIIIIIKLGFFYCHKSH